GCQRYRRTGFGESPCPGGDQLVWREGQRMPLEGDVSEIDEYKDRCVRKDGNRRQSGARDPCRSERNQQDYEQMKEVNPDQAWRQQREEPEQVIVIEPDDGHEAVTHDVA